jgi:hypothetical protein
VRDRLRDGPKRLQPPFSAKSSLQTASHANTLRLDKPADVQGFSRSGAAQESNLPSLGLPDLTGFEDGD